MKSFDGIPPQVEQLPTPAGVPQPDLFPSRRTDDRLHRGFQPQCYQHKRTIGREPSSCTAVSGPPLAFAAARKTWLTKLTKLWTRGRTTRPQSRIRSGRMRRLEAS